MPTATRVLAEIAQTLDSAIDESSRLSRVLDLLRAMLHSDRCSLLFDTYDGKDQELLSTPPQSPDELDHVRSRLAMRLRMIEDHSLPAPVDGGAHVGLPVVGLDRVAGFLLAERRESPYSDEEIRLVSVVAAQLGAYLTMLHLHKKAVELDLFKQEMFAVVVHDLKNPMAAVMANIDLLALDLADAAVETRECVADVQTASHRMLRLIANLLELARLESKQILLSRKPVRIAALLMAVAGQRTAQCKSRKVQIYIADVPERLRVEIDEDLFTRVLENILDNAVRYTPSEGRIEIRVTSVDAGLQVRIGNTGSPIPPADQSQIFEKFGQASISGRMNLGLGLYFVRMAIEAHGGRVWVEETPELPAIFVLELPRLAPRAEISSRGSHPKTSVLTRHAVG